MKTVTLSRETAEFALKLIKEKENKTNGVKAPEVVSELRVNKYALEDALKEAR
jgi:hypothetical protein